MRKLNRVIAAGALAVPMALGASGIAVAAEGSSGVQNQVGVADGNGSGSEENILDLGNRDRDSDNEDNFLERLLRDLLGEDGNNNSGNDSLFGGDDSLFGENDSQGDDSLFGGDDSLFGENDSQGDDSSDFLGIG